MVIRDWYRVAASVAAIVVFAAGPALAGGGKHGGAAGPAGGSDPAAAPRTDAAGEFMGRHTMEGEVTRIDQDKGTLSLKTAEGTMDLHFPPSALADVKAGDRVAVELAIKPDAGGSASPRTDTKQ